MARIKKSRVINGFSYHFSGDKLIEYKIMVIPYPSVIDPSSNLFIDLQMLMMLLQQYNIIKYGGNIDSFEDSITQAAKEQTKSFL